MKNKVIGAYRAVINGKQTGFAGCNTNNCLCADKCLRKDKQLTCLTDFGCNEYPHSHYVAK